MQSCNRYDLAEEQIKAFTRSSVRAKVFLCLKDGPKTVRYIEKAIGIRTSTILHSVKEMIEAGLIKRTSDGYRLTNIGEIQAVLLDDLVSCIVALDEHKDFWQSHDISGIPIHLRKKIGMLTDSEVFKDGPVTVLSTQEYFISELKKAKRIYGVSPIIAPGYAESIACAVENGSQVDLIITGKIFNIIIKESKESLIHLLASKGFRLYCLEEELTVAFTVTDRILSLGLFRQDGRYDVTSDLNCRGEKALLWGRELFDYYLHRSKPISSISD